MSNILTHRFILSVMALSTIGGLAMIAQAGTASAAKNVLSCDGSSRRSVVECCETLVRKNGLPMWLKREGKTCRTGAVICTSTTSGFAAVTTKRVCRYVASGMGGGGGTPGGGKPGGGQSFGGKSFGGKP